MFDFVDDLSGGSCFFGVYICKVNFWVGLKDESEILWIIRCGVLFGVVFDVDL